MRGPSDAAHVLRLAVALPPLAGRGGALGERLRRRRSIVHDRPEAVLRPSLGGARGEHDGNVCWAARRRLQVAYLANLRAKRRSGCPEPEVARG
eukprot:533604-Alexandrium_andersonii.AAC.1